MVLPRPILLAGGLLFTLLAFVGAILPLVPTTPFLLLACYCFARSAPRIHAWILEMPLFGKYLRQWSETHSVPRSAKVKGVLVVLTSFGVSAYLADMLWLRLLLVGAAMLVCVLIWRLPSAEPS